MSERLKKAAAELIADIRRRYPDQELRCQYMEADDEPIKKAAAALKDHLFGKRWDLGYLAVGSGKIFVYIIGKWYGETTDNWNGYPVEWQENCGPIEALADLDGRKG